MAGQAYTVQSGDTLSGIAQKYGVNYQDIAKANGISNPNLIYPGQTFNIPGAGAPSSIAPAPIVPGAVPAGSTPGAQPTPQAPQPQQQPQVQGANGGDTELQQLAKTDRNPVQETRYQQLLAEQGQTSGGQGTATPSGGQPTFNLVAATNAAFNTPEIQSAQKAITDRQAALAKASAEIDDNPLYSESTRVGKQAKLTQQANNDIKVQQDILAGLKADAQIKVNAAQGQYNIDNAAYKENLSNFNNLVSQGALDNAGAQDLAQISVQTGIPISMIQSIVNTAKSKKNAAEKPQIIQATDNQGNLSILAVDSNGTVLNQTTIAGAGKAATYKGQPIGENGVSGGGTAKPAKTPTAADQQAQAASIVADYLHNEDHQNQISPEDLSKELLLKFPAAASYITKYWTPENIRALST